VSADTVRVARGSRPWVQAILATSDPALTRALHILGTHEGVASSRSRVRATVVWFNRTFGAIPARQINDTHVIRPPALFRHTSLLARAAHDGALGGLSGLGLGLLFLLTSRQSKRCKVITIVIAAITLIVVAWLDLWATSKSHLRTASGPAVVVQIPGRPRGP
jgi:hypothetical protein